MTRQGEAFRARKAVRCRKARHAWRSGHGEADTARHTVRVRQCDAGRGRARQGEAGRLACRLLSILTVKYVSNLHLTCIRVDSFDVYNKRGEI